MNTMASKPKSTRISNQQLFAIRSSKSLKTMSSIWTEGLAMPLCMVCSVPNSIKFSWAMITDKDIGYYLRSVGAFNMIALLSCTALYSFFSIFPQYWLKWWTESKTANDTFYMLGYLVLSMVAWASTSTMLWYVDYLG